MARSDFLPSPTGPRGRPGPDDTCGVYFPDPEPIQNPELLPPSMTEPPLGDGSPEDIPPGGAPEPGGEVFPDPTVPAPEGQPPTEPPLKSPNAPHPSPPLPPFNPVPELPPTPAVMATPGGGDSRSRREALIGRRIRGSRVGSALGNVGAAEGLLGGGYGAGGLVGGGELSGDEQSPLLLNLLQLLGR